MNEFKPGDVVQLKSGGPRMTISKIGADAYSIPSAWCDWFETKQEKGMFPLTSLKHAEE